MSKEFFEHGDHTHSTEDFHSDEARADVYADIAGGQRPGFILMVFELNDDERDTKTGDSAILMQKTSNFDPMVVIANLEMAKATLMKKIMEDAQIGRDD